MRRQAVNAEETRDVVVAMVRIGCRSAADRFIQTASRMADLPRGRKCLLAVRFIEPLVFGHNHVSSRLRPGTISRIAGDMT